MDDTSQNAGWKPAVQNRPARDAGATPKSRATEELAGLKAGDATSWA